MIYPLEILIKNTDQIENLMSSLKTVKVIKTIKDEINPLSWLISLSENTPYFIFSVYRTDRVSITTDITTINLLDEEWKDDYINLYFDTAAKVTEELNGGLSDINPLIKKPFGILNPFLIPNVNESESTRIINEKIKKSLIEIVKYKIYDSIEPSYFRELVQINHSADRLILPIFTCRVGADEYVIDNLPFHTVAKKMSIGTLLFLMMRSKFKVYDYKAVYFGKTGIVRIKDSEEYFNPVIIFVPFKFFSTNPEINPYWKKKVITTPKPKENIWTLQKLFSFKLKII